MQAQHTRQQTLYVLRGRHLLISVPAHRVAEVEAALTFLEEKRQQRGSQVVIDLIV
jgi:hypothetical protein